MQKTSTFCAEVCLGLYKSETLNQLAEFTRYRLSGAEATCIGATYCRSAKTYDTGFRHRPRLIGQHEKQAMYFDDVIRTCSNLEVLGTRGYLLISHDVLRH